MAIKEFNGAVKIAFIPMELVPDSKIYGMNIYNFEKDDEIA